MMLRSSLRSTVEAALEEVKNKSKIVAAPSSSMTLEKRHRGRPLESKSKKPSTAAAGAAILQDISLFQPIMS
jgi:hypothetical protein